MNIEDEQLIITDFLSRLPYGVTVEDEDGKQSRVDLSMDVNYLITQLKAGKLKMVLLDLSQTTRNEKMFFYSCLTNKKELSIKCTENALLLLDWLNTIGFDYRGLIEKGLAIKRALIID